MTEIDDPPGTTYFYWSDRWGEEEDKPPTFGWAIARKREGYRDFELSGYETAGPYPTYADALTAWQAGALRG